MCDTQRAHEWHHPGSYQREGQAIHLQMVDRRIQPEEVELVIFTHLHWDHCSNMQKFSKARFIVHQKELEFALSPIPPYYRSYESPILGLVPPFSGVKFCTMEGEEEVAPGVRVFPTPGHSPGHVSVKVDTSQGPYVIAGDAVFDQENLKGDPAAHLPVIPIGRFTNIIEMWNSLMLIKEMSAIVLPGHDYGVFQKPSYPEE